MSYLPPPPYTENINHLASVNTHEEYNTGYYPSQPNQGISTDARDDEIISQALSFIRHAEPVPPNIHRLPRPIAIPQVTNGRGQSFVRAYPPSLNFYAITPTDFLTFLDNLNIVSTASPPLQALDAAGGLIGMVPHHWAQLAGAGIQTVAKVGTSVVSKTRLESYMKEVNVRLFMPRGLKVSITSAERMKTALGIPETQSIMAPLTPETMQMTTLQRVLLGVAPYNAALDFNVPRQAEQATLLAKWSAKQVVTLEKKSQKAAVKERQKTMKKEEKKSQRDEKKRAKKERKEEKRRRKGDRESESDSDSSSGDAKERKKSKEEKKSDKLLWVVIENLE